MPHNQAKKPGLRETTDAFAAGRVGVSAYMVSMVRRLPPPCAPVVAGSTPVVAFGDPGRAHVATLGINPSAHEFLEGGKLLVGGSRRLARRREPPTSSLP